jgi:biofilm protein TabA
MFIDHLENAERYYSLHPGFADGFAFLQRDDLAELPDGRHDIDGQRVFAIVSRTHGRGQERSPLEIHRRYIDIQFVVGGEDCIGWLPAADCRRASTPYDEQKDMGFFFDRPKTWVAIRPGVFGVFYPEDAHAPLAASGPIHKVVVKVAVDG